MNVSASVWSLALLLLCLVEVGVGKEDGQMKSNVTVSPPKPTVTKTTKAHVFKLDTYVLQRALYVLIVITVVGMLYFLVRAVRLKKITTPRKKYGLLSNYDDTVEMAQLESDDEDTTVYDARSLRR